MNNVINGNYNCNRRRESNIYNESFGERLVSFFCLIIAFFEDFAVRSVCRFIGAAFIAVGAFFYVSAFMAGELTVAAVLIYGLVLVAASALLFKPDSERS